MASIMLYLEGEQVGFFLGNIVTFHKFTPDGGVLLNIFLGSEGSDGELQIKKENRGK